VSCNLHLRLQRYLNHTLCYKQDYTATKNGYYIPTDYNLGPFRSLQHYRSFRLESKML